MLKDNKKNIIKAPNGAEIDLTPYKRVQEAFFSAKTKKFLAIFALVLTLFACVYRFVLPQFIKPQMVYDVLQSSVNEGYFLDVQNLKTDLGWDFTLVLDASSVKVKDKTRGLISSKKTRVKLPILSLLFKNSENSQFFSTGADVYLERDKSGEFNLKKVFKIKNSSAKIPKFRVAIRDYNIIFVDKGAKPIIFDGHGLDLGNLNAYRLKTFGSVAFPDGDRAILNINFLSKKPLERGEFRLKGDVENLNLEKIAGYLKEVCPEITGARGLFRGDFDIDAYGREKLTNNMKVSLNANNVYISTQKYPHFFEIQDDAQFFAEGKYYHHKLNFKKARIVSRDYNIELTGKIADINKKHKKLNIVIKSKNSNARKVLGLVPKSLTVKHDAVNKSLRHNIDAIVSCNLKVKGVTKALKYYGNINVKNFVVDDNYKNSLSKIDLSYKKRKITIKGTLIDSKNGIVQVFGTTLLGDTPYVNYYIYSDKFYLPEFRKNILAMADVFELSSGVLPDLEVNGFARMNSTIVGSGKKAQLDGFLQLFDATLKYSKIVKPVCVKFANIQLYQRKMIFKHFESFIDGHQAFSDGYISLDKEADVVIETKKFPIDLGFYILGKSELFEKSHKGVSKVAASSGNFDLKLHLKSDLFGAKIVPQAKIYLLGNSIKFTDFSPLISSICGEIDMDDDKFTLPKPIVAKVLGSSVSINGRVENNKIDAIANVPNIDFAQVTQEIPTSKACSKIAPLFANIKNPSGRLAAELTLKGDMNQDFFDKIECKNMNLKFAMSKLLLPVSVKSGQFSASKKDVTVKNIPFEILNSKGVINGKVNNISKIPSYNLKIDVCNIDRKAFEALKKCNIAPKIRLVMNDISDFSGTAEAHLLLNKKLSGKILFKNTAFRYLPASLPIKINDGTIVFDGKSASLPNSWVTIGNSKMKLSALYSLPKGLNLSLSGDLKPEEIDKYLNKILLCPINLKQTAPVKINLVRNSAGINITSGVIIAPENALSYKGIAIGDDENYYVLGGGLLESKDKTILNNLGISKLSNKFEAYLGFANLFLPKNYLQISGSFDKTHFGSNLHFYAREFVSTNLLNELLLRKKAEKLFQGGFFKGDITAKGRTDAPKILGNLEFRAVKIPSFKATVPSLRMIFTEDTIFFKEGLLQIADFDFNFEGEAENVIELPYVFKNIKITSDYVNIDELVRIFSQEKVAKGALPVFVVKNGAASFKRMVFSNLDTDDAKADLTFTPDWNLSLDNVSFYSANGEVDGTMNFDFATYKSNAKLRFKNLKANAVATTLLQMPNEIYGLLNGTADFSTKGITREDMIKNSNGTAKFQITSGRLVRMGSLEYLLMAAEVVKSGLTGLCINNVCTLLAPHKNGNFDTINVDFKVKNGVLFTDDLVSRGHNLSIYLAGNFDMTTNYSSFTILGRVSKAKIKLLGPIGNFSISKILTALPCDSSNSGVLESLSKFPGVDFNDKSYRRFIVNIEGDLYNPKSVKDFRWLD